MSLESQWTVYRTRFLVRAQQLSEPLIFTDALGREQSGLPGDYLVETSTGVRRITSKALFEDIYVPLAPGHGAPVHAAAAHGAASVLARPVSRSAPENGSRATA